MSVVTIVGGFGGGIGPGFSNVSWQKRRRPRRRVNLRKIYDGEIAYYFQERVDANGNLISSRFVYCMPVPAHPPTKDKRQGDFGNYGWPDIGFSPDGPIFYVYMVEVYPRPPNEPAEFPRGAPITPARNEYCMHLQQERTGRFRRRWEVVLL